MNLPSNFLPFLSSTSIPKTMTPCDLATKFWAIQPPTPLIYTAVPPLTSLVQCRLAQAGQSNKSVRLGRGPKLSAWSFSIRYVMVLFHWIESALTRSKRTNSKWTRGAFYTFFLRIILPKSKWRKYPFVKRAKRLWMVRWGDGQKGPWDFYFFY